MGSYFQHLQFFFLNCSKASLAMTVQRWNM